MNKRLMCLLLMIFSMQTIAAAVDPLEIFIPNSARKPYPSCTCDCENKIIFHGGQVTPETLNAWAKEAAISSYTFGFGNYQTALKKASQYFTPRGWTDFRTALMQSGNLELILSQHLLVSAVPTGEPKVIQVASANQKGTWKIEVPMILKYENEKSSVKKHTVVVLSVVQTKPHAGIQGLGIEQFVVEPHVATS